MKNWLPQTHRFRSAFSIIFFQYGVLLQRQSDLKLWPARRQTDYHEDLLGNSDDLWMNSDIRPTEDEWIDVEMFQSQQSLRNLADGIQL